MKIDISKLGYRWKGAYAANATYVKGDVVRKEGKASVYNGTGWTQIASDQVDANDKGELLVSAPSGTQLLGAPGQELTVRPDGLLEWQYTEGRRSSAAVRLPEMPHGGDCHMHGGRQNYAIMSDGTVRCWGHQSQGIGDGVVAARNANIRRVVAFPPDTPPIIKMWLGYYSAFAVDAQGKLWAWGYNNYGQLGVGNTTSQGLPVLVNGNGDLPADAVVVDVATGEGYYTYSFTMVRTSDGRCYHMGYNGYKVSGDGTGLTTNNLTPKLIRASLDIEVEHMIAMGHLYATSWLIDKQGRAFCAGERDSSGGVSAGENTHALWYPSEDDPIKVIYGSEEDEHITAGSQYMRQFLAISRAGNVYSWGQGYTYSGSTNLISPPGAAMWTATYDPRISNVVDGGCSSGYYHFSLVVKSDGTMHRIGANQYNVGVSATATTSEWTPLTLWGGLQPYPQGNMERVFVRGGQYVKSVSGITKDGRWLHWGINDLGVSGDGFTDTTGTITSGSKGYARLPGPIQQVQLIGNTTAVTANLTVTAITGDGNVYAWGNNANGECGMDDDQEVVHTPTPVLL